MYDETKKFLYNARLDFENASNLLMEMQKRKYIDIKFNDVCYYLHQTVEKQLEALSVLYGITYCTNGDISQLILKINGLYINTDIGDILGKLLLDADIITSWKNWNECKDKIYPRIDKVDLVYDLCEILFDKIDMLVLMCEENNRKHNN